MTVTIEVPAPLDTVPPLEVTEASSAVLTDIRAAATAVADVRDWARANGAPDDWTGDAAEAAQHAATAYAGDMSIASEALEQAALAVDTFLEAMKKRRDEHTALLDRRTTLNSDRDSLIARIDASTEDDVEQLKTDARVLTGRFDTWLDDVVTWGDRVSDDEDTLIAALGKVDSVSEAEDVADQPGPDAAALERQLTQLGNDTDAVTAWWLGLTPAQRNALIINNPDLIGNTNGIPTGDRDEANRSSLQRDIEYLQGLQDSGQDLTAQEQRWLENAQSIEQAIANADEIPYRDMNIDVNVMVYQPHAFGGDGAAAVAYGDPDTADHTAVYVPGIMQDGTTIDENGQDALALYDEASQHSNSVSTIAWVGYDSPNFNPDSLPDGPEAIADVAHTMTEENAEEGGHLLSQFVDGLNSTHQGDLGEDNLTVIGHSYGSTTSAHAAADGLDADQLVLIGSPGAGEGVTNAGQLNMGEGNVYAGSNEHDPVSWLGGQDGILPGGWDDSLGLGEDPTQSDFGAHNFEVHAGQEIQTPGDLVDVGLLDNHVSYFDGQDNPALSNMGLIMTGHGDEVVDTGGRDQDAHDYLYDWAGQQVQNEIDTTIEEFQNGVDTVTDTIDSWLPDWP